MQVFYLFDQRWSKWSCLEQQQSITHRWQKQETQHFLMEARNTSVANKI
jgi:hypothetical protein